MMNNACPILINEFGVSDGSNEIGIFSNIADC